MLSGECLDKSGSIGTETHNWDEKAHDCSDLIFIIIIFKHYKGPRLLDSFNLSITPFK